jgi:hypothetical protein
MTTTTCCSPPGSPYNCSRCKAAYAATRNERPRGNGDPVFIGKIDKLLGKPPASGTIVPPASAELRADLVNAARQGVKDATRKPLTSELVAAELKGYPDVGVYVNDETGEIRAFILPKPYFEQQPARNDHAASVPVTRDVHALRLKVNALTVKLSQRRSNGGRPDEVEQLRQELEAAREALRLAESPRDVSRARERAAG